MPDTEFQTDVLTNSEGEKVYRYPGVRPFGRTAQDRKRFFGRDSEIDELTQRILGTNLILVCGRSGVGKTSLFNAGLYPSLEEHDLLPIPIRFNLTENVKGPMEVIKSQIREHIRKERTNITEAKTPEYNKKEQSGRHGEDSLWEYLKSTLFWDGDTLVTPVLVFDQFEEMLVQQSPGFRAQFSREIGQILAGRLPDYLQKSFDAEGSLPFGERPPDVRFIISIREDFVAGLEEMESEIPAILRNLYRLTGLSETEARIAIGNPAKLSDGALKFRTAPFEYSEETYRDILCDAREEGGQIDPFLLQLFCSRIEEQVESLQELSGEKVIVSPEVYDGPAGLQKLISAFYSTTLRKCFSDFRVRRRAKLLCEEGLLTGGGRRRSRAREELLNEYSFRGDWLKMLELERLIRKEPRLGTYYYELSHDRVAREIHTQRPWRLPVKWRDRLLFVLPCVVAACVVYLWVHKQQQITKAKAELSELREKTEQQDKEHALRDAGIAQSNALSYQNLSSRYYELLAQLALEQNPPSASAALAVLNEASATNVIVPDARLFLLSTPNPLLRPSAFYFTESNSSIRSLAWSPGGDKLLLLGENSNIEIISGASMSNAVGAHLPPASCMAVSRSTRGPVLALGCATNAAVYIYSLTNLAAPLKEIKLLSKSTGLSDSVGGKGLDSANGLGGQNSTNAPLGPNVPTVLSFSTDGRFLAAGFTRGEIGITSNYFASSNFNLATNKHPAFSITSMEWYGRSRFLLVGSTDRRANYVSWEKNISESWNLRNSTIFTNVSQTDEEIRATTASADGDTCAWIRERYGDVTITLTKGPTERESQSSYSMPGYLNFLTPKTPTSLSFRPDGQFLAVGLADGTILLNHEDQTLYQTMVGGGAVKSLAFSPDGLHLAVAGSDKIITIWSFTNLNLSRPLSGRAIPVVAMAASKNGETLAFADRDGVIKTRSLSGGSDRVLARLGKQSQIRRLAFGENAHLLALSQNSDRVELAEVSEGQSSNLFTITNAAQFDLCANGCSLAILVTNGPSNLVSIYNYPFRTNTSLALSNDESPDALLLSRDGGRFAVLTRDRVSIYDVAQRCRISSSPLTAPEGKAWRFNATSAVSFASSPDSLEGAILPNVGSFAFLSSDRTGSGTISIIECATGKHLTDLQPDMSGVRSVVVSPLTNWIAFGYDSGEVTVRYRNASTHLDRDIGMRVRGTEVVPYSGMEDLERLFPANRHAVNLFGNDSSGGRFWEAFWQVEDALRSLNTDYTNAFNSDAIAAAYAPLRLAQSQISDRNDPYRALINARLSEIDVLPMNSAKSVIQSKLEAARKMGPLERIVILTNNVIPYLGPQRESFRAQVDDLISNAMDERDTGFSQIAEALYSKGDSINDEAVALYDKGDSTNGDRKLDEAIGAFKAAVHFALTHETNSPAPDRWERRASFAYYRMGYILALHTNRIPEALEMLCHDAIISSNLVAKNPTNCQDMWNLGLTRSKMASIYNNEGQFTQALEQYRKEQDAFTLATQCNPTNTWMQDLGTCLYNEGVILDELHKLPESLEAFRLYGDNAQKMVDREKTNDVWQREIGVGYGRMWGVLVDSGKLDASLDAIQKEDAVFTALALKAPTNCSTKYSLALDLMQRGWSLIEKGSDKEALQDYEMARQRIRETMDCANITNDDWSAGMARCFRHSAEIFIRLKDLSKADEFSKSNMLIMEGIAAKNSANHSYQSMLAWGELVAGDLCAAKPDPDSAAEHYDRALKIYQDTLTNSLRSLPEHWSYESSLNSARRRKVELLLNGAKPESASTLLDGALKSQQALVEFSSDEADWRGELGRLLCLKGDLVMKTSLQNEEAAQEFYRRSVQTFQKLSQDAELSKEQQDWFADAKAKLAAK